MSTHEPVHVTAVRTRKLTAKGIVATILVTVTHPDGHQEVVKMGGNRALRAGGVWAKIHSHGTETGCTKDVATAHSTAARSLSDHVMKHGGYPFQIEGRPAGFAYVEDKFQ